MGRTTEHRLQARGRQNQPHPVSNRFEPGSTRSRNVVIGKKPSSGVMSWGGANLAVSCYIGRVDMGVSAEIIRNDLVEMGVNVIDLEENQTRHGLFKSFKLMVSKKDFDSLNSEEKWPEGVVFRRFRLPRPPPDPGHVE